jgi:phenylalanyl-tRNA synthetase beta chain
MGINNYKFEVANNEDLNDCLNAVLKGKELLQLGSVNKTQLQKFSIKQPVYFISFNWENLVFFSQKKDIIFEPVPKFPQVQRDLAIVVNKSLSYGEVEDLVKSLHIKKLQNIRLFDVFENEKLGENK